MLKRKWRWIYMLLAVCLISIANPETVSAADAVGEKILVKGTDILTAPRNTVKCGAGKARYDKATKVLTLEDVEITLDEDKYECGVLICKAGVTVKLVGSNVIRDKQGIVSVDHSIKIKGASGSKLTVETENEGICGAGLRIQSSVIKAVSTNQAGIFSTQDLRIEDSEVTSSGAVSEGSIRAANDIMIIDGSTEIGAGKIICGQTVGIGGKVYSGGKESYNNIECGPSGEVVFSSADYSEVDDAIAEAEELNGDDYTNFELVEEAIDAVDGTKDFRYQSEVDGYAAAIREAIDQLEEKPEEPDEPEEPDGPEEPGDTEEPDEPEEPSNPNPPNPPQPPVTPVTPAEPEKPKTPSVKSESISKMAALNNKAKAGISRGKLKVTWGKVSTAEGYDIYAGICGGKLKLVETVKGNEKSSYVINRIEKKKIDKKDSYKVQVSAYRTVKGKKKIIANSLAFHIAGDSQRNYTNAKSLKIEKTKLTLKKGSLKKIKAKTVKINNRKRLFPQSHIAPQRYYSTNKSIATVSKNGVIKGRKKGTCTIYTVAANGVKKGVKVTVK